jgi:hypothetical protein
MKKRFFKIYKIFKLSASIYGKEKAELEGARRSTYPSQKFQERYLNLFSENIYHIYKMPTGYSDKYNANDQIPSSDNIQDQDSKFDMYDNQSLRVMFDDLLSKNKNLRRFSQYLGDSYKMYTVVSGVCSRFLPEDIEFFINNVSEDFEGTEYHNRMLNASKKLKLGFVPSIKTLRVIISSLKKESGLIERLTQ